MGMPLFESMETRDFPLEVFVPYGDNPGELITWDTLGQSVHLHLGMTMEYLYNRGCEILIGGYRFTYGDLTMQVIADFDDGKEPSESTVEIYNLSKHTLANIRTGMRVIVNAGYGKDLGTVLQGRIVEVRTKREQTERITTIQVKDDVTVSIYEMAHTYRPGTKASEIIHDLLTRAQIPHGPVDLESDYAYMKGFIMKGDPVDAIRRAASACKTGVCTRQGKLYFQAQGKGAAEAPSSGCRRRAA